MTVTERLSATAKYPPGWLVGQLPVGMRDDDMLVRFTTIFERLGAGLREAADNVEHVADPTVTPPPMLAYMGRWLGYDLLDDDLNVDRQRGIIAALGRALPMRGTRAGLATILEAVTAGPVHIQEPGWVLDEDGEAPETTGPVVVTVTSTGHLRDHEFEAIVRDEIPAHLSVRIVIDPDLGSDTP